MLRVFAAFCDIVRFLDESVEDPYPGGNTRQKPSGPQDPLNSQTGPVQLQTSSVHLNPVHAVCPFNFRPSRALKSFENLPERDAV